VKEGEVEFALAKTSRDVEELGVCAHLFSESYQLLINDLTFTTPIQELADVSMLFYKAEGRVTSILGFVVVRKNCNRYLRNTSNGCLCRTAINICATQAMAVCAELLSLSAQHKQWLFAQNCYHYLRNTSNGCLRRTTIIIYATQAMAVCAELPSLSAQRKQCLFAHSRVLL